MAYFNGYQPAYAPNPGFQQYPQMNYQQQRMDYLQSMQQPQQAQQPGDLQARIVTSREEAVAAQVLPNGVPFVFYNPNRQEVYLKRVDPQTGAAEFMDLARVPPPQTVQAQPVQYATVDDIDALRGEISQLREMIPAPRRVKGADAE